LLSFVLQGLDNVSSATLRPFNSDINTPRIDSYRFSMANLEGKFAYHSLGFIDPAFWKSHSICRRSPHVPDLKWISECVGRKSLWTTCVDHSSCPTWWLLSNFSPFFFSLRFIFLVPSSRWKLIDVPSQSIGSSFRSHLVVLDISACSSYFIICFFSISRRKRSSPVVREFFRRFLALSSARPLRGFRSEETLIVRQRSIGEMANETRYISSCRKNLFRPFIFDLGYLYFAFAASWSIDCYFLKRYEINLRSTLIVRVIQYVPF